jgi:putative membrane protein
MHGRAFLEPAAKRRTAELVRAIESHTAVEVVVAVRRASARYVATSVAFGAACGVVAFAVMWLSPVAYDVRTMPLDALLAAVLGAVFVASVAGARRALTPPAVRTRTAERAARAAFAALGMEKTRGRTGLLVYVSLFEGTAVLVPDTGIPATCVQEALAGVGAALAQAVRRGDFEVFLRELQRLGPACGNALPRQADDENELCDDVA